MAYVDTLVRVGICTKLSGFLDIIFSAIDVLFSYLLIQFTNVENIRSPY